MLNTRLSFEFRTAMRREDPPLHSTRAPLSHLLPLPSSSLSIMQVGVLGSMVIICSLGLVADGFGKSIPPKQKQFSLLQSESATEIVDSPKFGRFVHFTDMHPDQFYTPGSSVNDACHVSGVADDMQSAHPLGKGKGHKKKKKNNQVGHWGAAVSVCDAPKHLIESTLDWLADNWMPSANSSSTKLDSEKGIDFILWTGDTARHDIDITNPRTAQEIFDYNRWVLSLVEERFPGVPVVPNLGNNDIKPHNIMFPGPTFLTNTYKEIWSRHIPEDQYTTFQRGGYYAKEVIMEDLAVLSLNTLYWYDANAAVRGCKGRDDPGSIQLDWMEETLAHYRNRSMQVHLIGHVPPTPGNYFSKCYERYTDLALRYQDTVVGQHYGHMNVDAWFIQEEVSLSNLEKDESEIVTAKRDDIHTQSLSSDLREDFDIIPTKQKTNLDAYSAFFIAPSVVPTYLPTVRVWTYNATKPMEAFSHLHQVLPIQGQYSRTTPLISEEPLDLTPFLDDSVSRFIRNNSDSSLTIQRSHRRPRHRRKKHKKEKNLPRHTSPDSPSRKNTYLTMLGYSQWVLDLDEHNRRYKKEAKKGKEHTGVQYQLEYTTYEARTLWSEYLNTEQDTGVHVPVPRHLLDSELTRLKARTPTFVLSTHHDIWKILRSGGGGAKANKKKVKVPRKLRHLTNYSLPSFSIEHLLEWARELAGNDKMWKSFLRRIYTESGTEG